MLLVSSIIVIANYILYGNTTTDIHLHDTYFVLSGGFITACLVFLLGLETLLYFLSSNYRQFITLQYLHIASIFIFWITYIVFPFGATPTPPSSPSYYNLSAYESYMIMPHLPFIIALLLFVSGQFLFVFNLLAGFIRGKKTSL